MSEQNSNEILLASFKDTFEKISIRKYLYNVEDKTSNDSKLLLDVFNNWQKVFVEKLRVNNAISEIVFKLMEGSATDIIDTMLINVEELKKIEVPKEIDISWNQFLFKVIDHIKLIDTQQTQILKNTKKIEDLIKLSDLRLNELKEDSDELMEKSKAIEVLQDKSAKDTDAIKGIQEKSKNIQKEFIAILGIFASILIAAFGGLTSLASLFEKINEVATYKLVFLGSFEVLSILMILFLMLNGVAKLTGLNLRSCGCEQDCSCKIHKKHPTLFMLTILTLLLSFISLAPLISKFINNWSTDNSSLVTFGVYFVVVFVAVMTIIFTWFGVHSQEVIKKETKED